MQTQIRLAERQGLLRGYHISRVQFYALSVLELLDRIEKIDNDDRELRLAMVSGQMADLESAFPELKTNVVEDDDADFADDEDQVKYVFSNATYDPKAVEEEVREMMERAASSEMSIGDIVYDEWQ